MEIYYANEFHRGTSSRRKSGGGWLLVAGECSEWVSAQVKTNRADGKKKYRRDECEIGWFPLEYDK